MATRPYVPRVDGESSVGVATKKWGNIFAYQIDEATSLGNNASLGYRQPSTAQSVGDVRYHATLPAGWYLECTTAGTTGSGTLTITSPTVGGIVSDGTVTWTVRKNASTQDLTGYLPLSGGAMIGELYKNSNTGSFGINGGMSVGDGARLALLGKDFTDDPSIKGKFYIDAIDGVDTSELAGSPQGELTWAGNSLDKSAVVAESLGANGYRKYASGLIEQWGRVEFSAVPANGVVSKQVDLPISYTTKKNVVCSVADVEYSTKGHCLANPLSSLTSFNVAMYNDHSATQDMIACWFATGY